MEVQLRGGMLGFGLAFANAGLFALYIVLAHRVSRQSGVGGIDGLAAAMLLAVPAVSALGGWQVIPHLLDPVALGAGIGVGITSSVIPYVCDQLAMARLARATYSLMVSLLPATATVVGLVVLGQTPTRPPAPGCLAGRRRARAAPGATPGALEHGLDPSLARCVQPAGERVDRNLRLEHSFSSSRWPLRSRRGAG